jgi:hypothetical protein
MIMIKIGAVTVIVHLTPHMLTLTNYIHANFLLLISRIFFSPTQHTQPPQYIIKTCKELLRRYSQSGKDLDEMVEIKKSRVSCYIFSTFMNNLIQWRKSEAGLPKPISDFVSNHMLF